MLGKLFCGVMYSDSKILEKAILELKTRFGEIELESEEFEFGFTSYYEAEFGPRLKKRFIVFKTPIKREELPDIKLFTCEIEKRLGSIGKRGINIDPGYVTLNNVVVASTKEFPSRIYLGKGIFGDLQLILKRDEVQLMPYTYADYKLMKDFFLKLRHLAPR
jgi:hypothetical protein